MYVETLNQTVKKRGQIRTIWFRYKKNKLAVAGLILLGMMIATACSAELFADYTNDAITHHMGERLLSPSTDHIFGTDQYGRDVFARILYGARISLSMGLASVAFSLAIGAVIGAAAGYYGGRIDNILMRIMDVFLAIPGIVMAISVVAALGEGMINLLIAMSVSRIPQFARIVRSSILSIKGQDFIEAAKSCGTSDCRIILRHILPNAMGPIIVQATLNIASAILGIAALSFIGLGIEPPIPEWGSMLSDAKSQMRYYPYLIIIPGISIILAVLALNLIGDGLRDAMDPRTKK